MNLKRTGIILVFSLLMVALTSFYLPVENIQVRLFANVKVIALVVYAPTSSYRMLADGNVAIPVKAGIDYRVITRGDSIVVTENEKHIGVYRYLKFVGDKNSEIKIRILSPEKKVRTYQNNVSFSGGADSGIRIINDVILDNYIAGVTEAEAGPRSSSEFYKVQAILARTFALAHINKHVTEGFSLCDQVHCQAYFGKPRNLNIYTAIAETQGKVVVDDDLHLIVAAFHSNSGGQTANSEDVWGAHTPYLRSIIDTFSTKMPNSKWERRMLTQDWLNYLKVKHNFPVETDSGRNIALNFKQDTRKVYLECSNTRVPLKNVRQDLQLRSTFFSISKLNNDSILFSGRGYGHGLGMCQEGAMYMVRRGYTYTQILDFYYKNIQVIDLHKLNFFKDE